MKMPAGFISVSALALLAGCGGGSGGDAGSSGPIVTVTPPAPTPSPPPSPPYQSARDFSQDRNESDFGSRIEEFRPYGPPQAEWRTLAIATTTTLGDIGFNFTANPKAYRAYCGREAKNFTRVAPISHPALIGDQDYNPADPSPSQRFSRLVHIGPRSPWYQNEYVGYAGWTEHHASFVMNGATGEREISCGHLYGAKTVPTDLPATGTATYATSDSGFLSKLTLTVDWTTGAITGSGKVSCHPTETCAGSDIGDLVLRGQFDGSSRFLGTLTGSAGYTGNFVGSFYGPRAIEVGFTGDLRHATRRQAVFVTTGNRY